MSTLEELKQMVIKGKKKKAVPLVEQCLEEGIAPQQILDDGLIAALDYVGEKFSAGELFVPEMLVAARTMAACTEVLKPRLSAAGAEPAGYGMIATVAGDMHDIGKNLVRMMLEGKGFEMADLGVDVSNEAICDYLREHPECKLVCLSALLTVTMPALAGAVKAIKDAGLDDGRTIFVGGAPVTQAFCDEIGADYYTVDAGACAAKAAEVMLG